MQRELRTKNKAGFTIFEVAMAAAVMALAISSSLLVMGRAFSSLNSARCISYASQIMQSELEKMRLTQWGNGTTAGTGSGTVNVTSFPTTWTEVPIPADFTSAGDIGSKMKLYRIAANVHAGMIVVTLKIQWTTFDGRTMTRSYITYYGKNGLYDYFIA